MIRKDYPLSAILVIIAIVSIMAFMVIPVPASAQYAEATAQYKITATQSSTGFVVSTTPCYVYGIAISGSTTSTAWINFCDATTYAQATNVMKIIVPPVKSSADEKFYNFNPYIRCYKGLIVVPDPNLTTETSFIIYIRKVPLME